jgi:hypothetical protein
MVVMNMEQVSAAQCAASNPIGAMRITSRLASITDNLNYLIERGIFADDIQAIQSAITQVAIKAKKKLQKHRALSEWQEECSIFSSSQERASIARRRTLRRVKVSPSLSLRVGATP